MAGRGVERDKAGFMTVQKWVSDAPRHTSHTYHLSAACPTQRALYDDSELLDSWSSGARLSGPGRDGSRETCSTLRCAAASPSFGMLARIFHHRDTREESGDGQ